MTDFTRLLGPISKWLWKYFEKAMRDSLTFSIERIYDRESYREKSDFIPIRVKIRPGLLQTRVKAVYASNCTICVDNEYLGKCGALGQWRHRPWKKEPYEGKLDLKNYVVPARDNGLTCFTFVIWVRPKEVADEITIELSTSSWLQPPSYILVLGATNV